MTTSDTPNTSPEEVVDQLAQSIESKGLAKYLADTEFVAELAVMLKDELRIPPALTKLILKALVPLVMQHGKKVGSWVGAAGARTVKKQLTRVPGAIVALRGISSVLDRLSADAAAKRRFDELLEQRRQGRRSAVSDDVSSTHGESNLSRDLRADLEILESLDEWKGQSDERFAGMQDALEALRGQLSPQPPLRLIQLPVSERTKFVYGSRSSRLVGRENELGALDAFLMSSKRFAWWVLTGPGGMGKSRVALELGLRFGVAFRVGFLRWPWRFDWDNWQPDRPTLIVVDYAESITDDLQQFMVRLAERDDLSFPVRVLLLARHAIEAEPGPNATVESKDPRSRWFGRLLGSGSARALLTRSRHAEPLELRGLDDRSLWSVVTSFIGDARDALDATGVLAELVRIDPQRRPLFAAFVGDALSRGVDIRAWNRTELLENIRREEALFWDRAHVTENERELLMVATMVGGLSLEDARTHGASGLGVDTEAVDVERYSRITGAPSHQRFGPLEPDILGEFYVLERLAPQDESDSRPWQVLRSVGDLLIKGLQAFLERASADFPEHVTIQAWLRRPPEKTAQPHQYLAVLLAIENGRVLANQLEPLREVHKAIRAFHVAHPDMINARDARALSAGNLSLTEGLFGNVSEAEAAYRELAELSDHWSDSSELRDWRARVASDLAIDFASTGNVAGSRLLVSEFEKLSSSHPTDAQLRETWSRSAYHYLHIAGAEIGANGARPILRRLVRAAANHPADWLIVARAARAIRNLLVDALGDPDPRFGNSDKARSVEMYEELRSMMNRYARHADVRTQFYLAAEVMYRLYRARGENNAAAGVLRDLKRFNMGVS